MEPCNTVCVRIVPRLRLRDAAVGLATWAFVVTGGVAPIEAQEFIHACVKGTQGQVRIVAATESCLTGEQRVQWPASAPSMGALRVVDADGKVIGRYADSGNTIIAVGADWISVWLTVDGPWKYPGLPTFYFNTPCPNPTDETVLHGTEGYLDVYSRELVKFAAGFEEAANVVYYRGDVDPTFVALSFEYSKSTETGQTRVCYTFTSPLSFQQFAPARTFDVGVFTPPYRVIQ